MTATTTSSPAAFLLARLSDLELANANSHAPAALHENYCSIHPQGLEDTWCSCDTPARVLRQCAAMRAIVAWASVDLGEGHSEHLFRALASIYADRPGFQEAWL